LRQLSLFTSWEDASNIALTKSLVLFCCILLMFCEYSQPAECTEMYMSTDAGKLLLSKDSLPSICVDAGKILYEINCKITTGNFTAIQIHFIVIMLVIRNACSLKFHYKKKKTV